MGSEAKGAGTMCRPSNGRSESERARSTLLLLGFFFAGLLVALAASLLFLDAWRALLRLLRGLSLASLLGLRLTPCACC
jgi:hypothetical protein